MSRPRANISSVITALEDDFLARAERNLHAGLSWNDAYDLARAGIEGEFEAIRKIYARDKVNFVLIWPEAGTGGAE